MKWIESLPHKTEELVALEAQWTF